MAESDSEYDSDEIISVPGMGLLKKSALPTHMAEAFRSGGKDALAAQMAIDINHRQRPAAQSNFMFPSKRDIRPSGPHCAQCKGSTHENMTQCRLCVSRAFDAEIAQYEQEYERHRENLSRIGELVFAASVSDNLATRRGKNHKAHTRVCAQCKSATQVSIAKCLTCVTVDIEAAISAHKIELKRHSKALGNIIDQIAETASIHELPVHSVISVSARTRPHTVKPNLQS